MMNEKAIRKLNKILSVILGVLLVVAVYVTDSKNDTMSSVLVVYADSMEDFESYAENHADAVRKTENSHKKKSAAYAKAFGLDKAEEEVVEADESDDKKELNGVGDLTFPCDNQLYYLDNKESYKGSSFMTSCAEKDDAIIEDTEVTGATEAVENDVEKTRDLGLNYRTDVEVAVSGKYGGHPEGQGLSESEVYCIAPTYVNGKMKFNGRSQAMCTDIREPSNWTAEDFYSVLPESMYDLVPIAIRLEKEVGVNALYIIAVGANETGWGTALSGRYNYFNWTFDDYGSHNFDSLSQFSDFSVKTYSECYIYEDWFTGALGFRPSCITPEVVNVRYAIGDNGYTNWYWVNVVTDIMSTLSCDLLGD